MANKHLIFQHCSLELYALHVAYVIENLIPSSATLQNEQVNEKRWKHNYGLFCLTNLTQ